jgi:NhaA family Na+:H+ antiporter
MAGIEPQVKPIQQFPMPAQLRNFIKSESSAGVVMICMALLALFAANSGFAGMYKAFISAEIGFSLGDASVTEPLKIWVKDILMVFFFMIVGLELKKEFSEGFLSKTEQIALPFIAAAGGMLLPALVYLGVNMDSPEYYNGWAIPAATDIAFALCILMLAGKGVPPAVKVFLLAIAIFDDLGAILIIAFFYSSGIHWGAMILAAVGIAMLYVLQKKNVTMITPYMIGGLYLWFCFYHAGIHTTVAGVLVGLLMPMRCSINTSYSPVNYVMHFMLPWVNFLILPLFAFTAAGVGFKGLTFEHLTHTVPMGIALALFFGKQVGVFGATWLAVTLGGVKKPEGANWLHVYGVAILAGIGFTMSLFIGALAFDSDTLQSEVKMGVLAGSLLSTIWGAFIFYISRRCDKKATANSSVS